LESIANCYLQFVLEMPPSVDLVIIFKGSSDLPSKQQIQTGVQKAEQQYSRLLTTLKDAGLSAVGRRGEKQGVVLVLVACPESRLSSLMQHER
jgi:anoctamin-10